MIEINNKKMCRHCFRLLSDSETCKNPKCVSHDSNGGGLSEGSVLNGKYIVGRMLYYDRSFYGYIGYDATTDSRVLIREFFPFGYNRPNSATRFFVSPEDLPTINSMKNDFCAEVNSMSNLGNEFAVARVCELFEENGTTYSVVEYPSDGMILSEYAAICGGQIPEKDAIQIMAGAMKSLDAIHSAGLLHGNIRPENIIINRKSITFTGFNFGPFKIKHETTSNDNAQGNLFAPIEYFQTNGKSGSFSDIYSLGATIYFILTGNCPEHSYSRAMAGGNTTPNMTGISPKFAAILTKMLALKSADRYTNLHKLSLDLKNAKLVSVNINSPTDSSGSGSGRKKLIIILAAVLATLIMAGGAAFVIFGTDLLDRFKGDKEPENEIVDNENTDDENADGENTDGENNDGENTDGENTDGENTDGENTDGENTDGENTDGKNTDGENTDSDNTDGENTDVKIPVIEQIKDKNTEETQPETPAPEKSDTSDEDESNGGQNFVPTENNWVFNSIKSFSGKNGVFGNENYSKKSIVTISVLDSTADAPDNAWDISQKNTGNVLAWVTPAKQGSYNLILAGNGGINLSNCAKDLFLDYENVTSIVLNGNLHSDTKTTDTSNMFKNCKALKTLDVTGLNTEYSTNMSNMFENCKVMTSITFSDSFSTANVTSMKSMFDGCFALKSLDLSMFNTKKVTDMSAMFYKCWALTELDLSGFVAPNLKNCEKMFFDCKNLKKLDMSNLACTNNVTTGEMFDKCPNLSNLSVTNTTIKGAYDRSR